MPQSNSPTFLATENDIAFTKVALPFGWLGNMSAFPVIHQGIRWLTTEHLFQALRFSHAEQRKEIREQGNPFVAKLKSKGLRKANEHIVGFFNHSPLDETDLNNMKLMLRLKVAQHELLLRKLVNTQSKPIIEDIGTKKGARHEFWGARKNGDTWVGHNRLGNMWMELRNEILAWKQEAPRAEGLPPFLLPFTVSGQNSIS